ncbi:unnamed protein product, partial [Staurois parvus]
MLVILTVEPKGLKFHIVYRGCLILSSLILLSSTVPNTSATVHSSSGKSAHALLVCIAREFFFSWESACDQHRANQYCSDRGQ